MCPFFSGPKYHNLWINQVWYGDPIISHYSLYMRGLTLWPVVRRDKWIIYWGASESEWLDSCNNVISIFGTDYLLQITILSKQPWVYIFLKNPYLSYAHFMLCFQNSKTSWNFLPKIRIFSKKQRKICKKWWKNTKINHNEQK